jgi:Ni,Fe-hydrogenase I cytochrome b subunit
MGRWPIAILQQHPPLQDVAPFGFLLMIVIYDLFSLRRVSLTTVWAAALLVVVHLTRVPLGMTAAWHSLADWVIGKG